MSLKDLSGGLNLLALKNSKTIEYNGVKGIFIPYSPETVTLYSDTKAFLNIYGRALVNDAYKNDYMVSRTRTKEEKAEGKYSEILGNMKLWTDYSNTQSGQDSAPAQGGNQNRPQQSMPPRRVQNDDDPF